MLRWPTPVVEKDGDIDPQNREREDKRNRFNLKEAGEAYQKALERGGCRSAVRDRDRSGGRAGAGVARGRSGAVGRGSADAEGAAMIVPPAGVRVLIATRPVDFRRGADGLAAVVQTVLRQDPFSGTIFVFRCKRADRVKLLVWDGSGLVLIWKRLESSGFKWPPVTDGVMRLSAAQLAALLEGLDWSRVHVPRIGRPKVAQ